MNVRTLLLSVLLLAPVAAHAQRMTGTMDSRRSTLAYAAHHPTHDWRATSRSVTGTVAFDPATPSGASVTMRVPVESFDSGNDSRDDHMIDAVKGDDFPTIVFTSSRVVPTAWTRSADGWSGVWQVTGGMQFAGRTVEMTLPVRVAVRGTSFSATSQFPISITAFGIRPPSLLGLAMRDNVEITATLAATLR
ncbi:MAG: YceI family protein [Bacteroidetes bacterium]|nr:YceI family protein [Bacteroidota bacterium]